MTQVASLPGVPFTAFSQFSSNPLGHPSARHDIQVRHAAPFIQNTDQASAQANEAPLANYAPVTENKTPSLEFQTPLPAIETPATDENEQTSTPRYIQPRPHFGYPIEEPKHICSVQDVVESSEVCTPALETVCNSIELAIKIIVDVEQCYTVTRTVCTESIEVVPQEVCTYSYDQTTEDTTAKTVEVTFEKITDVQMVTVCQPGHGYGGYGHNYCKEVAQETAYNAPVVTPVDVPVTVAYPAPVKTCVDKPINLPVVTCADLTEDRTIQVPTVEDSEVTVDKCVAKLGEPACQKVELTLPKQVCKELAYGDAHVPHAAPAYPAAPAPEAEA